MLLLVALAGLFDLLCVTQIVRIRTGISGAGDSGSLSDIGHHLYVLSKHPSSRHRQQNKDPGIAGIPYQVSFTILLRIFSISNHRADRDT
jgi:hypothetical protein